MANSVQKKIKFSKGQVSPKLIERTDLDMYDSSAQKMENVVSSIYGGVNTRRGTELVDNNGRVLYGNAVSYLGGVVDSIQNLSLFTSDNIGASRDLFQIDYEEEQSGVFKIRDVKLDKMPELVSSQTDGSFNVTTAREFYIELAGGGGGGSNLAGGRGASIKAYINLPVGKIDYTIGAGGAGAGAYVRNNNGKPGNASTLTANGVSITCGGGNGRNGRRNGGGGGTTGTLSYAINQVSTIKGITTNGEEIGTSYITNDYNGFGAGGKSQSNDEGSGYSGKDGGVNIKVGYIKLVLSASSDGVVWDEVGKYNITTESNTITANISGARHIKATIEEDINYSLGGTISFTQAVLYSASANILLKKFIYNEKDKYLLAFSDNYLDIYKDNVLVKDDILTGISYEQAKNIKLTYKDDTVIITHPDIPTKELKRLPDGWSWKDFEYKNIPYFAFGGEQEEEKTIAITPTELEGSVRITAESNIFTEDWVGQYIDGNGGRVRITEYVDGKTVNGVTVIPFYTKDKISKWKYVYGYELVWSETRGYPRTCLFAQQRLWFGGSRDLPTHLWASRLGDYNNFKNAGNYDNDAIDVTMLTNNPIVNIIENRGIHIFTTGEEFSTNEDLRPDGIAITPNTKNGSLGIVSPVIIAGTVCYIEKNGKSVLNYVYDYNQASYVSNNLSLFTDLINNPVSMDAEINSSEDKGDFIYLVLEDGTALVSCIVLDQNIVSMSSIKMNGKILDVCCLEEDTYFVVERNGTKYIEKLSGVKTDFTQRMYLNSNEITGLSNYDGEYVYVYNDTYSKKYRVSSGAIDLDKTLEGNYYIGIPFKFCIESNPIAINNKTITCKKRISKATLLCYDTERVEFNGQIKSLQNEYNFYACTSYGNDVRFNIKGEFYPVNILSITLNLNFEG